MFVVYVYMPRPQSKVGLKLCTKRMLSFLKMFRMHSGKELKFDLLYFFILFDCFIYIGFCSSPLLYTDTMQRTR
ncbi:hypothetical protein HanHA300_Chr16g0593861 [Helianthus annuus]|nr:hypothetical protein HanHA300_Chr16g0593861 [Helianthus annuus]KAJ0440940.1 hypothetical protein HanIR_Chr16g0792181 [Helianthus annuus]KAJ0459017.1 hypothetical protein HanHA89_Chr16g0644191 [Helianthus annuus]